MALKDFSIALMFVSMILNVLAIPHTKTVKQQVNLQFSSSLTIDEDLYNVDNVDMKPKITNRRDIQGIDDQHGRLKILNRPTSKYKKPVVIFPNNDKPVFTPSTRRGVPKPKCHSGQGRTYCETVSNYPDDLINRLMASGKFNITLSVDNAIDDALNNNNINLTNRIDIGNEIPLCMSQSRKITPEQGETDEGDLLFLVKGQSVIVDECKENVAGAECRIITGLTTKCEQTETIRKLYALDKGGKEIRHMKFKFPSCCKCKVYNSHTVKKRQSELEPSRRRKRFRTSQIEERQKRNANSSTKKEKTLPFNWDFAYPDQIPPASGGTSLESRINVNCTESYGSTLCLSVKNYPTNIIATLKKRGAFRNSALFGNDDNVVDIATRIDGDDTSPMCGGVLKTIFPEAAKTIEGVEQIVIQSKEDGLTQGINVEECATLDAPCNFANHFPESYKTSCKQKYIYRTLAMIDDVTKEYVEKLVPVPSCCVCHVKVETNIVQRVKAQKG